MYEAELYSKNNLIAQEIVRLSLRNHGDALQPLGVGAPLSIMEIGVGDGNVTKHCLFPLLPEGTMYVGTDSGEEMIAFARRKNGFSGVDLEVLDVTTDQLPEKYKERFDRVIGFNVLHIVTDVRKSLQNIYDMLKPGGKCYLTLFEQTPLDEAFSNISKNSKWSKYGTDKYCTITYRTGEGVKTYYPRNMEEIGFKGTKAFLDVFDWSMEVSAFKEIAISVNQDIKSIPEDERNDYIEDYLKAAMEQKFIKVDGDHVNLRIQTFTLCASK